MIINDSALEGDEKKISRLEFCFQIPIYNTKVATIQAFAAL